MDNLINETMEVIDKKWTNLIQKADAINAKFHKARITISHTEFLDDKTNEWIKTYAVFGIYIQTKFLVDNPNSIGYLLIATYEDALKYLSNLEHSFEVNGVINTNEELSREMMDLQVCRIPLEAVIEFLNTITPEKGLDSIVLGTIQETHPNLPTDELLNKQKFIFLTTEIHKFSITTIRSEVKTLDELNKRMMKELNEKKKPGRLLGLANKHKDKEIEHGR